MKKRITVVLTSVLLGLCFACSLQTGGKDPDPGVGTTGDPRLIIRIQMPDALASGKTISVTEFDVFRMEIGLFKEGVGIVGEITWEAENPFAELSIPFEGIGTYTIDVTHFGRNAADNSEYTTHESKTITMAIMKIVVVRIIPGLAGSLVIEGTGTEMPSPVPTSVPTAVPTSAPTAVPTSEPTSLPTSVPSAVPVSVWNSASEPKVVSADANGYVIGWSALAGAETYDVSNVMAWNPVALQYVFTVTGTACDISGYSNVKCITARDNTGAEIDKRFIYGDPAFSGPVNSGLILDDFSDGIIDPRFTVRVGDPLQMTESGGVLNFVQSITDNGPALSLDYDSGNGNRYVSIAYKALFHRAGDYFYGNFIIRNRENSLLSIVIDLAAHSDWDPLYGTVVRMPDITPQYEYVNGSYHITTLSTTERFDQWMNVEIVIDKLMNSASVAIDGAAMGQAFTDDYEISDKLILNWDCSAWWTGHEFKMDDLEIRSYN